MLMAGVIALQLKKAEQYRSIYFKWVIPEVEI
jgi:hypothetical protein